MTHIWIYLTIYLTPTNNTSPCPNEKLNIKSVYASKTIFKGYLLQVGRCSYFTQVLTPPASKFLNFI